MVAGLASAGLAVSPVGAPASALPVAPAFASASAAAACTGVSVVVDFGSLGGAQTRCFAGDPSSGLQALSGVGFSYAFVPRQPGLVCQINGLPNPCNGAPTNAYWSYWYAQPGGSWTYSTTGAGSRNPAPGGVDGWAFGAGAAPGIAPPAAAPPPAQPPPPPQKPPAQPSAQPPAQPPAKQQPPAQQSAKPGATAAGAGTPAATAPSEQPAAAASTAGAASSGGGSAGSPGGGTSAPGAQGGAEPAAGDAGGVPLGLVGGLVLVALLGGAAFWTARRRRAETDPM